MEGSQNTNIQRNLREMLSIWWVLLSDFTYVKEVTVNLVGTTEGPEAKHGDRTEMGVTETRVTPVVRKKKWIPNLESADEDAVDALG